MTDNYDFNNHESVLRIAGKKFIAGVDEAGRGPLMGPVVTAAVILPENDGVSKLNDSKKLTAKQRELTYKEIISKSISIGISASSAKVIDRVGILPATLSAMTRAVNRLKITPDWILVDGKQFPKDLQHGEAIVNGDNLCRCIAAASIVAKVTRDRLMNNLVKLYPQWNFHKHKGYCTAEHERMLSIYPPTPHHRFSFEPIRQRTLDLDDENKHSEEKTNFGRKAEQVCCAYLSRKGWTILQTNYKASIGEIDIIGKESDSLVFVEVKASRRKGAYLAQERVTQRKRIRLWNTAKEYLRENEVNVSSIRFDVIAIYPTRFDEWKIEHIRSAFTEHDLGEDL